jgi:chaperonin GroEL
VNVGAATETEMKEKQHRVAGPGAALEQGSVSGGGIALLQAANADRPDRFGKQEENTGAKIALGALEEPLRQIAHNAGLDGSVKNILTT